MAITGGRVELVVQAKGEDQVSATLKQINQGLDKAASKLQGAASSSGKASGGMLALAGRLTGVGVAAGAALGVVGELTEMLDISAGAKAADQFDTLSRSVRGFEGVVERAKAATTGMIPEAEIVQGAALFRSFGLDVQQLPSALEQVSKTAIRTGQDAAYLSQSLVTGVARMSPAILDNLGVTIRLSEATDHAAQMFGKSAEALTDQEKRAGMLALTLDRLSKANEPVDLTRSRAASIQRVSAAWDDLKGSIQSHLADAAVAVLDWFSDAEREASDMERRLASIRQEMPAFAREVHAAAEATYNGLEAVANRVISRYQTLFELANRAKTQITQGDQDRIATAAEKARQDALKDAELERAERLERINKLRSDGLMTEARYLRQYAEINNNYAGAVRNADKVAKDAVATEFQRIEAEKAAAAAAAERERELRAQLDTQRSITAEIMGQGPAAQRLAKLQADAAQAASLPVEQQIQLQKDLAQAYVEAQKEQRAMYSVGAKSGAGQAKPRDVSLTAELELQMAMLDAQAELTHEQREERAVLEHKARLIEVEAEYQRGAITEAAKAHEIALADWALQKDLVQAALDRERAESRVADQRAAQLEKIRREIEQAEQTQLDAKLQSIAAGFESIARAASMLSSDFGAAMGSVQGAASGIAAAMSAQAELNKKTAEGVAKVEDFKAAEDAKQGAMMAGIDAAGTLAASVVDGEREQAAIFAAMEAAKAFGAYPDVLGMAQHATAAAMFAAIAGGAVDGGKGGGAKGGAASQPVRNQPYTAASSPGAPGGGGPIVHNYYNGITLAPHLEQQAGQQIGHAQRAVAKTGMGRGRY